MQCCVHLVKALFVDDMKLLCTREHFRPGRQLEINDTQLNQFLKIQSCIMYQYLKILSILFIIYSYIKKKKKKMIILRLKTLDIINQGDISYLVVAYSCRTRFIYDERESTVR